MRKILKSMAVEISESEPEVDNEPKSESEIVVELVSLQEEISS